MPSQFKDMLDDGIYGLRFTAAREAAVEAGSALAVLRGGRVLGSDPWGGVFTGTCAFDASRGLNTVRLCLEVPPEGTLITGFSAGPAGATLDIVGTVARPGPLARTVVEVAGMPLDVELTYLGPLPG